MHKLLPDEIVEAIEYEIGRNRLEFVDNYRAYRHRDGLYRDEYRVAVDGGCCGFFDVSYIDSVGDAWTIGCNYGH